MLRLLYPHLLRAGFTQTNSIFVLTRTVEQESLYETHQTKNMDKKKNTLATNLKSRHKLGSILYVSRQC